MYTFITNVLYVSEGIIRSPLQVTPCSIVSLCLISLLCLSALETISPYVFSYPRYYYYETPEPGGQNSEQSDHGNASERRHVSHDSIRARTHPGTWTIQFTEREPSYFFFSRTNAFAFSRLWSELFLTSI